MLPFFRKKTVPPGPHAFGAEIEIDRPASEVYRLLDLADPLHAKRQLGDAVEAVAGEPGTFTLVVSELPDAVFTLTVTEAEPGRRYAFSCSSVPLFGRVVRSHEDYVLDDLSEDRCRLLLTNTAEFKGAITKEVYEVEAMMLTLAGFQAVTKIKLHAEEGIEAVRAYSRELFDPWDDGDEG
jgi:hypothetical protein